jgi:hypothetical protein
MPNRKPKIQPKPEVTAYTILNKYLKDNDIILGLSKPQISYTDTNQIIISQPNITAVFKSEVTAEKKEGN